MGPTEMKFAKKLDRELSKAQALEKEDITMKYGSGKKKALEEGSDEFSSIKGTKPHWYAQRTSNHVFFSEYAAYKPGDREFDEALSQHIYQADRAMNFERDFICGDPGSGK